MPSTDFRLPALGADMDDGTIVEWHVAPGSPVKRGDVVAVVETDKGAIDVEIFVDGVVREIVVAPGTKIPVGTVIARIETAGAAAAATEHLKVSPAARKRAHELGVDLAGVTGTGPAGAITVEDVAKAGGRSTDAPPQTSAVAGDREAAPAAPGAREQPAGMRAAIAEAMSRSKREIPHYYLSTALDVTSPTEWLAAHNAAVPVTERLLFAVLLVKSIALACRATPGFNGFHREGRYQESEQIHVGVAVALRGGGLVAPAILDADGKTLPALMEDLRGLVTRARAGRLRASELAAPTIILTSLGDSQADLVLPIIQPPQVAIVGAGAAALRPWVVDGVVQARQVLTLSLGADHRVTDGRLGAQFLAAIAARLADPGSL